ncbi:site-specific DNA-methyltransferase [Anaerobacillus sp. CMMVII]|nr:site-specific DNA-methyltransferase [Anaerobacillus sp. CMMVII]MCT8136478.1 site-specific DNA-methyltransferase [Anaerobacillus sp. CMMVII]
MTLLLGDCLEKLIEVESNSVDLIYLDPPFFTQKTQKLKTRDNSKEYSFHDSWDSIEHYKAFIKERLVACQRVLKETGSIFLHCDKSASHYLRTVLDEVFGMDNFQSEIIWSYKRWSNSKKGLLNSHQTIYFYSKTDKFKFNTIYTDYAPSTNIDQILQDRIKDENGKSIYKKDEDGNVILGKEKKGVPLSDVWNIPYLNPKAKKERVIQHKSLSFYLNK